MDKLNVYTASKGKHRAFWQEFSERQRAWINNVASWVFLTDAQVKRRTSEFHWARISRDIQACDVVLVMHHKGENQKGAIAERALARVHRKPIFVVCMDETDVETREKIIREELGSSFFTAEVQHFGTLKKAVDAMHAHAFQ